MRIDRRAFLVQGVVGASLVATGVSMPGFLARTARAATPRQDERTLVVVQLTGGNDGLNTVIPFADDAYHRARPSLRISADRVLRISDTLGLHPEMSGLHRLHQDGLLNVVMNVGYPNPDRSHFRSMDIWHTADLTPEDAADGWLGRAMHAARREADAPPTLHLGDEATPLALRARHSATPSIRSIDSLRLPPDSDHLAKAVAEPRIGASDDLLYVQRVAVSSCSNAARLSRVGDCGGAAEYPSFGLAQRLRQIAALIGADFGPRVYYTTLGGFDTHARQALAHGPLLREFSDSVAAFFDDLKSRGRSERVALLTFSEFGRRVMENGSQGTDHGAAAPVFLVGPGCRPGVTGGALDLSRTTDGDVAHQVDFRSVYAAVLEQWLGVDSRAALGGAFAPARLFRA